MSWQSKRRLEKNFQTPSSSEGSEFIKSRDTVGTASIVSQHSDSPGRVYAFRGLVANFDSLKTKNIPVGNMALGDCLGGYRVSTRVRIFASYRVRKLACKDLAAHGNGCCGAQSAPEMTLVLGFASAGLVQGLAPVTLVSGSTEHENH